MMMATHNVSRERVLDLILPTAAYEWRHPSKDGKHEEVWFVHHGPYGHGRRMEPVRITVDDEWFAREGSINDLKTMAISEAEKTLCPPLT
jgi:hypothetical protein